MKTLVTSAAALLAASTTLASAGGLDRSGQSIAVLFEEGRYAEFSLGGANPDVTGVESFPLLAPFDASGQVSPSFVNFGAAYKADLNDTLSYAVIYDQPFGATVDYDPASFPYVAAGSMAEYSSQAITGVLQYNFPNNVSLFGGLRLQESEANATIPFVDSYSVVGEADWGVGYVLGAAYEKPEIALRVALAYNSEIEHSLDTTETSGTFGTTTSSTEFSTPQSVNLEFQSGIAADTLLFGSVRWVEWGQFEIAPADYSIIAGRPLVAYPGDYVTWTLGVGRRLSDMWSVAATLGYEEPIGDFVSNLGPVDGFASIGFGATYTHDNIKVTGGIRFIEIGDAMTQSTVPGVALADFTDNTAVALGVKVGYSF